MPKTYQISNNVIFSVNDDGSISKFAIISDEGEIRKIGDSKATASTTKRRVWGYWVVIVALIAGCVALFSLYNDAEGNYRWQQSQTQSAESKLSEANFKISELESEKSSAEEALSMLKQKVGSSYPLIINSIEIANTDYNGNIQTDYGNTIYSSNTMYLMPRISYYGVESGNKTLKVKWYNPNGTIRTGSSSPAGFSQSESCYISSGADNSITLRGWGSTTRGNWVSGNYRIEIWYGNTCLKSKSFTIY